MPAPIQRVADTRLGSLILLVGVPAMVIFGWLNIKMVDGFPTISLNGNKASELRRAASQHLNDLEHQAAQQNWGVATEILHAVQGEHTHNPSPYNPLKIPASNASYMTPQQQQQVAYQQLLHQQQQSQQQSQRQYQQQPYYPQQSQQAQHYQQQGYAPSPYQQTPAHYSPQTGYQQQPAYQQPGYQQPGYQQPTAYQQPTGYLSPSYPQQAYQQPNYPASGMGQTAYLPNSVSSYPNQQNLGASNIQPVPVRQNGGYSLPSSSNSSQLPYTQSGQIRR